MTIGSSSKVKKSHWEQETCVQTNRLWRSTKAKKFWKAIVWSMKVELELCWRFQDVRGARTIDSYQGEIHTGAEPACKWEVCCKAERADETSKPFDIKLHRATGFRIFLALFPLDLLQHLLLYSHALFWNCNAKSVVLYVGNIQFAFWFYKSLKLEISWSLRRDF